MLVAWSSTFSFMGSCQNHILLHVLTMVGWKVSPFPQFKKPGAFHCRREVYWSLLPEARAAQGSSAPTSRCVGLCPHNQSIFWAREMLRSRCICLISNLFLLPVTQWVQRAVILEESEFVIVPRKQFHNSHETRTLFSSRILNWGEELQLWNEEW